MRYTPEQKYHFILIESKPSELRFGSLYLPWADELIKLEIGEFTCAEHHRVPGDWDDKIQYDGYVFIDKDGAKWNNQFPRASYGQLDTDNDWRLWPVIAEYNDKNVHLHMTDLTTQLESILRGIRDMKERLVKLRPGDTEEFLNKAADSLRQFYIDIDMKLRTEFGLKAVNVGYTARFTNGEPDEHMPHIPDVKLVPVDQEIEHITY